MKSFVLSLVSKSDVMSLQVKAESQDIINGFISDWLTMYSYEINPQTEKVTADGLQRKTAKFLSQVDIFIKKYSPVVPQVHEINKFLKTLDNDEHFVFVPGKDMEREDFRYLHLSLQALHQDKTYDELRDEFDAQFADVLLNYRVVHANGKRKYFFGPKDKSSRICRYCSQTLSEGVTFNCRAHTISEALGNKMVITHDECDQCNLKFGQTIEQDLVIYFDFFRTFFRVQGKGGLSKIKGKNFELFNEDSLQINLSGPSMKASVDGGMRLRLEGRRQVQKQNIYKALCKSALGIVNSDDLGIFAATTDWINGKIIKLNLPKIAILQDSSMYVAHPEITLHMRQNDSSWLPKSFALFRFTIFTLVYIVPSDDNSVDFCDDICYQRFWEVLKYLHLKGEWDFQDFSSNEKVDCAYNLNFVVENNTPS